MNPIKSWLNGPRSYALGVVLFSVHGNDPDILTMFQQGPSPYRQRRLEDTLRKLISAAEQTPVASSAEPVYKSAVVAAAVMPETNVPEAKDPYRHIWLPLYMEMNSLRHQLIHAPDDHTRGEWAFRILALERECTAWWDKRDYLVRTGTPMPEEQPAAPVIVTDRNELHRRLTNLRTYIAKAEAGKTSPAPGKIDVWKTEAKSITQKLESYE